MSRSRYADAAGHWLGARDALAETTPHDPRHVVGDANAGAAFALLRRKGDAEAAFAAAQQGWMQLRESLATWDLPLAGRSSAFHFRLASKNMKVFQDAQRAVLLRKCEAALAVTRFNRSLLDQVPSVGAAAKLASLLSEVFGPRTPEVRLLDAIDPSTASADVDSPYAEKASQRFEIAASPSDPCRHLDVAVALTALLRPGLGQPRDPRAFPNNP